MRIYWEKHYGLVCPVVQEVCVGMEVTSYESAEIDTFN